jgi:phage shock protein C
VDNEAPGGGSGTDLSALYVVIGVILILVGLGLLGGIPFLGWTGPWGVLRDIMSEVRRIGWPLAIIVLGVLVIVYSRRPGAKLPSRDARLTRSRDKKVIAGVLGGLSDYFSVDVTVVRVAYILFALIFNAWGPLIIAYIAAAIIVPEAPKGAQAPPLAAPSPPPPPPPPDTEDSA